MLKRPSKFMVTAMIVTCGLMAGQNFASAASDHSHNEQVQDSSLFQSAQFSSSRFMASKSMDGDSVRFLIEGNDVTYEGLPDVPRATPVVLDMKDAGCVVNVRDSGWAKFGEGLAFHGARDDLLVVDSDLARVSNANHEMGHCVDFAVMPKLMAEMGGTGANINSVINIALTQALDGDGAIDLSGVAGRGADYVLENRLQSVEASIYNTAIRETYADLHAVYQTAALTGSLDSFTGVINTYRQAVKWDMDHADNLAIYRILAAESASGANPADLIGKSHAEITEHVNAVFMKHFYKEGKLSIHSEGFKSIAEEMHIRATLTPGLDESTTTMIKRFDEKVIDSSSSSAKIEFMALSQKSIQSQQELLESGRVGQDHLAKARLVVEKQTNNHVAAMKALGVTEKDLEHHASVNPMISRIFENSESGVTEARAKLYNITTGSSIMRRAFQDGSDYRMTKEHALMRASFKDALKFQNLVKEASLETPNPG